MPFFPELAILVMLLIVMVMETLLKELNSGLVGSKVLANWLLWTGYDWKHYRVPRTRNDLLILGREKSSVCQTDKIIFKLSNVMLVILDKLLKICYPSLQWTQNKFYVSVFLADEAHWWMKELGDCRDEN